MWDIERGKRNPHQFKRGGFNHPDPNSPEEPLPRVGALNLSPVPQILFKSKEIGGRKENWRPFPQKVLPLNR